MKNIEWDGVYHIHPMAPLGLIKKLIIKELSKAPNKYESWRDYSIVIDTPCSWRVSLVPRKAILQKKAIFWAFRGNRTYSSPTVDPKWVNPEFLKTTNKLQIVFKIKDYDFDENYQHQYCLNAEIFIITAYPTADNNSGCDEPNNITRKVRLGRTKASEKEYENACDFWANHVLLLEKGETYCPVATPKWYKKYWEKKYKKS